MTKANFTIPERLKSATGVLKCASAIGGGEFVLYNAEERRYYLLNPGDKISGDHWSATVIHDYDGRDKLNGHIGNLITLPEKDAYGYHVHIFLWRTPFKEEDGENWLTAHSTDEVLTVEFGGAAPLAERSDKFVSGRLEPFHEQGMEGNIGWAIFDTQKTGYSGLNFLKIGDKLTIFDESGKEVLWQGTITPRRLENLKRSCFEEQNRTAETQFLIRCFFRELPAILQKKPAEQKNT